MGSFINKPKENIAYIKAIYAKKFVNGVYHKHDTYGLPDDMQETVIKLKEAFNKYVIVPCDLRIDLFSGEKIYFLDDPEYLGWKKYALKGVNVYHVSGNHDTIFDNPNYQIVAKILQQRLDEINS